jgi:hypothetical protein
MAAATISADPLGTLARTFLPKRVQNHRIDLADALARRAELGRELDDPPSEVRGLIERHEQLRELEDEDPVENAEDFYPRTCRAAWRPTWSGRSSRANRRSVWRSNTAGEGVNRWRLRSRRSSRPLAAVRGLPT